MDMNISTLIIEKLLLKSFDYNDEILINTKLRIENFKKDKIWT